MIALSNMKSSIFHLNMRLVVVVWTGELSLLPHSFSEQHNLQNQGVDISKRDECEKTCSKRKTVISLILKFGPLVGSSVQNRGPRNSNLPCATIFP